MYDQFQEGLDAGDEELLGGDAQLLHRGKEKHAEENHVSSWLSFSYFIYIFYVDFLYTREIGGS